MQYLQDPRSSTPHQNHTNTTPTLTVIILDSPPGQDIKLFYENRRLICVRHLAFAAPFGCKTSHAAVHNHFLSTAAIWPWKTWGAESLRIGGSTCGTASGQNAWCCCQTSKVLRSLFFSTQIMSLSRHVTIMHVIVQDSRRILGGRRWWWQR